MANSSLLSLSICFLVLFRVSVAQIEQATTEPRWGWTREARTQQDVCRLERINAVEPNRRIQSEAGITDIWDEDDEQFLCAGVVAMRHTIQEKGLLLPHYVNGPKVFYVVEGNGLQGTVFPGCPETFQSSAEFEPRSGSERGSESWRDRHQKVRRLRQGDVIALPAGAAQWVYNDGRNPLVIVQIIDTSSPHNQLDENHRDFFIAGNPQREIQSQRGHSSRRESRPWYMRGRESRSPGFSRDKAGNIFSGIDERVLADAFNVNTDVARRMRGQNDNRGIIVTVEQELKTLTPDISEEEQRQESEEEHLKQLERPYRSRSSSRGYVNGVEETFCTARLRHNINDPARADLFNPRAGRVTTLSAYDLPILDHLHLSVQKVVLYRNAIMTPHWNTNAHCICYFTGGSGRVQIVDDNGETVYDGQVQRGQFLVVPQNFVVVKRARNEGLEWIAFKTNAYAKINQLAGRVSAIRSIPEEVLANAFQVSREDARRLKENRQEVTLLSPGGRSPRW